jgi:hypothetical protein
MDVTLPLDKMTIADKLRILEEVWDDLQRTAENVPSPAWHADVLRAREKRLQTGSSTFTDWDKAKNNIRDRTK